jgi:O-antigen/teichoic acid export membrane protein
VKDPRTFARRVFFVAGIYGLVVLLPQYFMEDMLNQKYPPAITHPENFYGFVGIAIAWQFVFLTIAGDVERFRPFMLPSILEKLIFGIATFALYAQRRVALAVVGAGSIDIVLAIFFTAALLRTRNSIASQSE